MKHQSSTVGRITTVPEKIATNIWLLKNFSVDLLANSLSAIVTGVPRTKRLSSFWPRVNLSESFCTRSNLRAAKMRKSSLVRERLLRYAG